MKKTLCIFTFFSIFLTLIACKNNGLEKRNLTITKSDGTTITISAEIAKTNEDRARGYMERKKISFHYSRKNPIKGSYLRKHLVME